VAFYTEYQSFKAKASDVKKYYNHKLKDVIADHELLKEAMNLGVLAQAQYVICTFYVGNALLAKGDTQANWYKDGTYIISTYYYTEANLVVLDTTKGSVVFYDGFKEKETSKLNGTCEKARFTAEWVGGLVREQSLKPGVDQQLRELAQSIGRSLRNNSIYIAQVQTSVTDNDGELVTVGLGKAEAVNQGNFFGIYSKDDTGFSYPLSIIKIESVGPVASKGKIIAGDPKFVLPGMIARAETAPKEKIKYINETMKAAGKK
jgi:hypothetical protein